MTNIFEEEARAALAAKGEAERQLAAAATCPPWRHVAFGAVMAALVAMPVLPLPYRFAMLALVFAAILMIVQSDRRRMGMFVNGYRRGKTLLVALPLVAVEVGLYLYSVRHSEAGGGAAISLALAAVAFVSSVAGSILWQRVFVRELGA